jgi:hypothetical protein
MKLRADIRPYFQKIADYYWDNIGRDFYNEGHHITIWDWLKRDYSVVKIGQIGSKTELWVTFPDEQHMTMFMLRWT